MPLPELRDAASLGFDAARLDRIGAFLEAAYVGPGRLPNAEILVARDGQPVYHAKAGTLGEGRGELPANALFRIASMTKPVTSIAFMQLVEQCKVALEDPVTRVLPELGSLGVYAGGGGDVPFRPTRPAPPIRFVDLLTHMAGFTYGLQNRTNVDAAYRSAGIDLARSLSSDDYIEKLSRIPLQHAPGERWTYSVATDVLGIAIERLSGQRLGEYIREHIFGPLGMEETAFDLPKEARTRLVDSHAFQPGDKPRRVEAGSESAHFAPSSFHSGGGGLVSTIADYHRFCAMLLGGGALDGARIIAPKTLDLMTANHLPGGADLTEMSDALFSEASNAGTGFGLGFAVVTDPARTLMPASRGEYYWGGAYFTAFFVDPLEGITMVFMTQLYPSNVYPIRRQLKTLIYSALVDSRA
ncbi:serine hydrolase domain-containing protein [Aurantiacibacter poecillastricola]|uniref:serine hydrolase domain-containing protein n=1 Tax=Aurantiacibacter poecillastricola TaxID=3064385 RepID=UPI00273E3509|nr:serine hydrolase domain-containing protein [Aurantiacibacter sp. 219JJ12-13]MDP5261330.1 serine hydrolase domain-containing protein [Aurantiacibacter sp. 219JJ12-13]